MSRPSRRVDQEAGRLTPEQLREFEARKAAIPVSDDPEDRLTAEEIAELDRRSAAIAAGDYLTLEEVFQILDQRRKELSDH